MIRSVLLAVAAAMLALGSPASAQDALLPQFGLAATGACRQLSVRDRSANANVPIGCVRSGGNGFRLSPSDLVMTALAPMNLDFTDRLSDRHNPPNGVVFAVGNRLAFCPSLSCAESAIRDHQRASLLVSAETQVDGQAEEQTLAVLTTIKTGEFKDWAPSAAFVAGDNIEFDFPRNTVYRQTTPSCSSAASGSGPMGKGSDIVDGTCRWTWINDTAINAKAGIYNEVQVVRGGGKSWAQANNFMMKPGTKPSFQTNTELDFTNNSGTDCIAGVSNCLALYIRMAGSNRTTSAISIEGVDASARGLFGARFDGPLADTTIDLGTSGLIGLGIGTFTPATYSSAAISDNATAPVGLNMTGTKSLAAVRLAATANTGIALNEGSYSAWQIIGKGFSVDPAGNVSVASAREAISAPPATSSSPCSVGQRQWDSAWEYRCVATNTWKRAPLSSW